MVEQQENPFTPKRIAKKAKPKSKSAAKKKNKRNTGSTSQLSRIATRVLLQWLEPTVEGG